MTKKKGYFKTVNGLHFRAGFIMGVLVYAIILVAVSILI